MKNDGVYSKYFTAFRVDGRHSLKVRVKGVEGKSRLTLRQSHALYVPGYIENGKITFNSFVWSNCILFIGARVLFGEPVQLLFKHKHLVNVVS